MGTRGDYLDNFLKKLNLKHYDGIYAANTVPMDILEKPIFCIIVNTDLYGMPGKHWLSLIKYNHQTKIFDSASTPKNMLFPPMIKLFSKLNAKKIRTKKIQANFSDFCGFYCIHEILKFNLFLTNKRIKLLPFSTNPFKNDEICIKNIEKMVVYYNKTKKN